MNATVTMLAFPIINNHLLSVARGHLLLCIDLEPDTVRF
jgi:hypothetical protein